MSDENSGSQNLPASVVEFIQRLLKKMRYRSKIRQDVHAELTAHFEDELKDCKTDGDKEQKAEHLITEFGDLKLLAILLRRAKKRCRPLWRTVVARTFQTIGVLILCFIFYAIWFSFGEPTISVDYLALLNQMDQPGIRNQDNAWPHYEKAISLYVEQVPGGIVNEFTSLRYNGKKREEALRFKGLMEDYKQEILEWLRQNQKHWDNLSPHQQSVILKCFEFNYVPFFRKIEPVYVQCRSTTFGLMADYVLKCIREKTQLTASISSISSGPGLSVLGSFGFSEVELRDWQELRNIPPHFLEAVSVAVLHETSRRYKDLPEDISAPLTDVEYEYISPWLKQNEPAWWEFLAGSKKSYCYRPYNFKRNIVDRLLQAIIQSHRGALRRLAVLGIWYSRIKVKEGKTYQALEDCLAVVRVGSHWQGSETIIEQLAGLGINRIGHREILHILSTQRLSGAELEYLQQQLSELYPEGYPLMDIEAERLAFLDIIQRSFTDGGLGGGHLIPGQLGNFVNSIGSDESEPVLFMPLYTVVSMIHARRDETLAKFNQIYDHQNKIINMTPYERRASGLQMTNDMLLSLPRYRFFLIEMYLPIMERASRLMYWDKAYHEAIVAIVAFERWRLEKDEYPAALGELVSTGFLSGLPMDPYSDKPLVYIKTDDDFILYSVGSNFADDGGKSGKDDRGQLWMWADNGDTVFWPVPKP